MTQPTQHIWQNPQNGKEFCFVKYEKDVMRLLSESKPGSIDIPVWGLLGKGEGLTEEQAAEIVEHPNEQMIDLVPHYKDYEGETWEEDYYLAIESLNSLIRSLGFEPAEVIVLQKVK